MVELVECEPSSQCSTAILKEWTWLLKEDNFTWFISFFKTFVGKYHSPKECFILPYFPLLGFFHVVRGCSPSAWRHADNSSHWNWLIAFRRGLQRVPHPFQQGQSEKPFREKERNFLSWEYGTKVQAGSASEPRMDVQLPGNRFLSLEPFI